MEWILGLSILAIVLFIILLFILPFIITVIIASNKGYSGCLWFLIAAVLGWIAVIIVICMPNLKKQEQRHQETIAALTAQNAKNCRSSCSFIRQHLTANILQFGKRCVFKNLIFSQNNLSSKRLQHTTNLITLFSAFFNKVIRLDLWGCSLLLRLFCFFE